MLTLWRRFSVPALTTIFIVMTLLTAGALRDFSEASRQAHAAEHLATQMEALELAMVDAETNQRGYIITDDPGYLKPYQDARIRIMTDIARLDALGDATHTQARVSEILETCSRKLIELQTTIDLRNQSFEASRDAVDTHLGLNIMLQFRSLADRLIADQHEQVARHNELSEEAARWALVCLVGSVAILFVFVAANTRRRHKHEDDLS